MNKTVTTIAAASFSAQLLAGTVAWYHFDELPDVVGNGVKAGTAFSNAVSPGTLDGVADSVMSTGLASGDWVVKRSDAWDVSMLVRDPSDAADVVNGKSLVFSSGGSGMGVVRIPDTGTALPTANFTVEFFIRLDNAGRRCVLVSRGDYSSGNYWFLEVTAANKLQFAVASGGTVKWAGSAAGNVAFNDGKWHHVAIRRAGNLYWAAYLDYATAASLQPGVANDFLAGQPIIFGRMPGNGNDVGLYNCPLDELRISDTGLDPAQMLSFAERDYGVADGVVSHLRFDEVNGYVVPATFDWAKHPVAKATLYTATGGTVARQADNAVETVKPGFRTTGAADRGSLVFTGDATTHASGCISNLNVNATLGGSFTVETFFKTSGTDFGNGQDCGYLFDAHTQWYVRFKNNGNLEVVNKNWAQLWTSAGYNNGEWHHIAFTYDAPNTTIRVYLDYNLKYTTSGWPLAAPSDFVLAGFVNSGTTGGNFTFDNLSLDEFRITSRVLSPAEFLTSEYIPGPTLLWAGFDNSLAVTPSSAISPAGTISGSASYGAGAGNEVRAADHTVVKAANPASLILASGATATFSAPLVCVSTNTIEFFVRTVAPQPGAPLVSLCGGAPSSAVWTLGLGTDGETLAFTPAGAAASVTSAKITNGAWNHVALVTATPASGNSTVKVSVNGGNESIIDLGCRLVTAPADPKLVVGGIGLAAQIDELRISEGELPSASWMKFYPIATTVIFR